MSTLTAKLSTIAAAAALLLAPGAAAQARPGRTEVVSLYRRPPGLLAKPPARLALARPAGESMNAEAGARRAERLAAALGVPLAGAKRKPDDTGETLRLVGGRHRFKVYLRSGMIKYRDEELYNRPLPDEMGATPLAREKVLSLARDVVARMTQAGLLRADELLYPAARFSSRMENELRGAPEGAANRRPPLERARAADFRVFIPRGLGGVPVAGHGVRLTFTPGGRLAGLDLLVRDATLEGGRTYPLRASAERARTAFRRSLRVPRGSRVEILAEELVYLDPGMRDPAAFLEPVYQFVYRVKTPIPGQDEFRISKALHWELPAIRHGERQVPSLRDARLRELAARFIGKRPAAIPQIRKPGTEDEERDEGEP